MNGSHIAEPLDYLYEALSPDRMAEARRHLAASPECRARVRGIRETVREYREIPRPAAPEGLAAAAAAAAIAAADKLPRRRMPAAAVAAALDRLTADAPEAETETGSAAAAGQISAPASAPQNAVPAAEPSAASAGSAPFAPAGNAAEIPDCRQARLEADFERLKKEVKDELRGGWRQWLFHPAWTVAALALLLGSLAVHFLPPARYAPPADKHLREYVPPEGAARDLRERKRIPAPRPHVSAEAPEAAPGSAAAPASALLEANARRDLPLPPLEQMRLRPPPAAPAGPEVVSETLEEEFTPLLAPEELAALLAAPEEPEAADGGARFAEAFGGEAPRLIERPRGFDPAERARTLTALAGMQIASGETADAWKTVDMLRAYSPDAAEDLARMLARAEQAAAPAPVPAAAEAEPEAEPLPAAPAFSEPESAPAEPEAASVPAEAAPVVVRLEPEPRALPAPEEPDQAGEAPREPDRAAPELSPEPSPELSPELEELSVMHEPAPLPEFAAEPAPPSVPSASVRPVQVRLYIQPAMPPAAAASPPASAPSAPLPSVSNADLAAALSAAGGAAGAPEDFGESASGTKADAPKSFFQALFNFPSPRVRERFTTDPYLRDE